MLRIKAFVADETGATAIEYSLIIVLISLAVLGVSAMASASYNQLTKLSNATSGSAS